MKYFGVLSLKICYGYHKKKPLYSCQYKENDKYKTILIPYQIRKLGFEKFNFEYYISFTKQGEFGQINENFGDVCQEENFFQFQLSMHNLHSVQKNWKNMPSFSNYHHKDEVIQDRFIFTIDPSGSEDLDDAFSVTRLPKGEYLIRVYISNVPVFLEKYSLWNRLGSRVSTIYLPEKNIPMLYSDIANKFCSLKEKTVRNCVVASFHIFPFPKDQQTTVSFTTETVRISKNFSYIEKQILEHDDYKILEKFSGMSDSHKVVEYWMLQFNCNVGKILRKGIVRVTEKLNHPFFEYYGKYKSIEKADDISTLYHQGLEQYKYAHASSPIRRFVDIINLTYLQEQLGLTTFVETTINCLTLSQEDVSELNIQMQAIKKVQMRCRWIHLCKEKSPFQSEGRIMKKDTWKDEVFRYIIFFPEYFLVKTFKTFKDYFIGDLHLFTLHYFPSNASWEDKVRVEIVTT
jgi:exoribonuclease R